MCLHPGSVQTDLLANMPFFIQIPMRLFRIFLRVCTFSFSLIFFQFFSLYYFQQNYFIRIKIAGGSISLLISYLSIIQIF